MTDLGGLISAAEQRYRLPPGILHATAQVESRFNPRAVSPKGALGLMQIMPATAASLGVDPHDPVQAIDGAGRLWSQNLKATGGDIDKAAMMYDAGPDPSHWNNSETRAYPAKLAAALERQSPAASIHATGQPGHDPSDPIEVALSGHGPSQAATVSSSADPSDPIEMALAHGNGASNVDPFDPNVHSSSARDQSGDRRGAGPDPAAGRNLGAGQSGVPGGNQGGQTGGPPGGLQQHPLDDTANWINGTADAAVNGLTAGLVKPFNAVLDTIIPNAVNGQKTATVWDGSPFGDAFHRDLALERGQADQFRADHPVAGTASDLIGALASPANKLFAPAEGAGFLRSIPNFMAQGAAYGGVRGASDQGTVQGALTDAGIGAALAPAGAVVAGGAGKLLGAALKARSTLANAIPQSIKQQVAAMIDHGASAEDIANAIPEAKDLAYVNDWVGYRARGGKAPVSFAAPPETPAADAPIVITGNRKALAAALGTQGSRRGVEAISDLPPPVGQDVQRLTTAGVSPEEALREAEINYVGAKPTVAAVTRNPAEQWAFNEGAKDTSAPTGQALNEVQAANNQALHDTLINTVDNFGGVPAQGEPAQAAAESLAQASDAGKARVSGLYKTARAQDGDVKINTDELRELLQSPEFATSTNTQVRQLSDGIRSHLAATDLRANSTLRSPEQIEDIRQLANSAFDPMGGQVNSAVSRIGKALDDGLDQLDHASAAYKAARAAHRDWASQYADPQGVQRLIARDAGGNFLNADKWRLAENGLVSRLDDKPFAQAVGQLKKIGANGALNKLKASVVQQAYERATNSARDARGNPVLNGKLFQQELNKIGLPKLQALFSPDEIAHLATIGRAARHLNEPVPGTVNMSNTSAAVTRSSLAKALRAKPGKHPAVSLLKGGLAVAGHVPAAVGVHALEGLSGRSAAAAVGQGVREQLNTGLARAMASRSSSRIENAQYRQMAARILRNRAPVASSTATDNRRATAAH